MILWLAALMGCAQAPTRSLRYRERWEMFGSTEDGAIVEVVASTGNTGLLRGQGRLRVSVRPAGQDPILLVRDSAPVQVKVREDHDAIQLSGDGVDSEGGTWTARFGSLPGNAIVHIQARGEPPAPSAWQEGGGQWTVAAPVSGGPLTGWIEAGKRGGDLVGEGVVLHRGGDGRPAAPRRGVFVLGHRISVGLDREGEGRLAWARVDGEPLDTRDMALRRDERGRPTLDLRPAADLWIELRPRKAKIERDPRAHLLSVERWLLTRLQGPLTHRLRLARAIVHQGDQTRIEPALMLREGP